MAYRILVGGDPHVVSEFDSFADVLFQSYCADTRSREHPTFGQPVVLMRNGKVERSYPK